jgi:hypothetical protein
MTGDQLRAARERLGASPADVADRAGVALDDLARWEASAVPRAATYKLDCALWQLECDAALAKSGLPRCEWVARFAALPQGPGQDPWLLEQHIGQCPACQARGRYVEKHVRRRPDNPWLAWMPAFPRAVLAGACLALIVSGGAVAALVLLILGVAGCDVNLVVGGAGLGGVCAVAGGVGGAVHHLSRSWRQRSAVGHYVSWLLAVECALLLGVALVGAAAWRGLTGLGADEFRAATHPLVLVATIVVGAVLGLAAGAWARRPGRG